MRIQFSEPIENAEQIIRDALTAEKKAGRIASHVWFKTLRELTGARRTRDNAGPAFEVQLEAYERDRGRRWGNSGSYGRGSNYTATHDEWGWLLSALYERDADLLVGTPRYPVYVDRVHFDQRTGDTYRADLAETIERNGDPYPYTEGRRLIGRRGYGRTDRSDWAKHDPRTAEWARAFYAGEVF